MGFVGFSFYGPHTILYYWKINPFIMKSFLPGLFPKFFAAAAKTKRVILSAFFDTFIYNLPYFSAAVLYTGLLTHKGNIKKAIQDVKN
jgi:hypothetical protein